MAFLNLTPHAVNLVDTDSVVIMTIPPSGTVARATQSDVHVGEIEGVEVVKTTFGEPIDLPAPQEGVWLVVSLATASAAQASGRTTSDLLLTSGPVRDTDGRIIGCRRFARL